MSNDNAEAPASSHAVRWVDRAGAVLVSGAALWDLSGAALRVPAWWPVVSYAAAGIGAAAVTLGVLAHLLATPARQRARGRSAARLLATGVLLLAWLLRGHPEIAPDPPIIGAQIIVALVLLLVRYR